MFLAFCCFSDSPDIDYLLCCDPKQTFIRAPSILIAFIYTCTLNPGLPEIRKPVSLMFSVSSLVPETWKMLKMSSREAQNEVQNTLK
jgi:hypothetical protein